MKKNSGNQLSRTIFLICTIVISTLLAVSPVSCRMTDDGIEISPSDTKPPSIEDFSVSTSKKICISCSEKIVLDNILIFEVDDEFNENQMEVYDEDNAYAVANLISYSEDGKSAEIEISADTMVGKNYIFSSSKILFTFIFIKKKKEIYF